MAGENIELAGELGQLRGRMDGLEKKLDEMGADIKWLRNSEARRSGVEQAEERVEKRGAHKELVHVGLVSGVAGGGVMVALQALLHKWGLLP